MIKLHDNLAVQSYLQTILLKAEIRDIEKNEVARLSAVVATKEKLSDKDEAVIAKIARRLEVLEPVAIRNLQRSIAPFGSATLWTAKHKQKYGKWLKAPASKEAAEIKQTGTSRSYLSKQSYGKLIELVEAGYSPAAFHFSRRLRSDTSQSEVTTKLISQIIALGTLAGEDNFRRDQAPELAVLFEALTFAIQFNPGVLLLDHISDLSNLALDYLPAFRVLEEMRVTTQSPLIAEYIKTSLYEKISQLDDTEDLANMIGREYSPDTHTLSDTGFGRLYLHSLITDEAAPFDLRSAQEIFSIAENEPELFNHLFITQMFELLVECKDTILPEVSLELTNTLVVLAQKCPLSFNSKNITTISYLLKQKNFADLHEKLESIKSILKEKNPKACFPVLSTPWDTGPIERETAAPVSAEESLEQLRKITENLDKAGIENIIDLPPIFEFPVKDQLGEHPSDKNKIVHGRITFTQWAPQPVRHRFDLKLAKNKSRRTIAQSPAHKINRARTSILSPRSELHRSPLTRSIKPRWAH